MAVEPDRSWAWKMKGEFNNLRQIKGNTWAVEIGNKIIITTVLIYRLPDNSVVLVESGFLKCPGLFEWLEENNLTVRAIICTHLHWDHIFNNHDLWNKYKCDIYVSQAEWDFSRSAWRQKSFPYVLNEENAEININGFVFKTLHTPGHTMGHQAVITPDNVMYLGDSMMTLDQLALAKLPFMESVQDSIESMQMISESGCSIFVASHCGEIFSDKIAETVEQNIQKEIDIYKVLCSLVTEPVEADELKHMLVRELKILNTKLLDDPSWDDTVNVRIDEMVAAGEFSIHENVISRIIRPC